MWVVSVLHIATIIAILIVLVLRLKVMLLVADAFNTLTLLYILSALGLYGSTLLVHEASRGLQPFFYPFGQFFSDPTSNFYYFEYRSNFFSSSGIQLLILLFCLVATISGGNPGE